MKYNSCRISLKKILPDFQNTLYKDFFFHQWEFLFSDGIFIFKGKHFICQVEDIRNKICYSYWQRSSLGTLYIMDFYETGVCFTKELLTILKFLFSLFDWSSLNTILRWSFPSVLFDNIYVSSVVKCGPASKQVQKCHLKH